MKRTTTALTNAVALLLAALLYHQTALAQVDPWERINLIDHGKKVNVKLHSGRSVNGRMESWAADGLGVRQGKDKVVTVAKSEVAQVAMVGGLSRARKAGYAFLVGGGIMGGLMAAACSANSSNCDVNVAAMSAASAVFVGGISAGIAALFPQHKEVIYQTQSASSASGASKR
jgi:hypothetical protein